MPVLIKKLPPQEAAAKAERIAQARERSASNASKHTLATKHPSAAQATPNRAPPLSRWTNRAGSIPATCLLSRTFPHPPFFSGSKKGAGLPHTVTGTGTSGTPTKLNRHLAFRPEKENPDMQRRPGQMSNSETTPKSSNRDTHHAGNEYKTPTFPPPDIRKIPHRTNTVSPRDKWLFPTGHHVHLPHPCPVIFDRKFGFFFFP